MVNTVTFSMRRWLTFMLLYFNMVWKSVRSKFQSRTGHHHTIRGHRLLNSRDFCCHAHFLLNKGVSQKERCISRLSYQVDGRLNLKDLVDFEVCISVSFSSSHVCMTLAFYILFTHLDYPLDLENIDYCHVWILPGFYSMWLIVICGMYKCSNFFYLFCVRFMCSLIYLFWKSKNLKSATGILLGGMTNLSTMSFENLTQLLWLQISYIIEDCQSILTQYG